MVGVTPILTFPHRTLVMGEAQGEGVRGGYSAVDIESDMSGEPLKMLNLYNTLTKEIDEVSPLEDGVVRMYTCGPTVYRDAHIGNLRSYLMADWIRRILSAQGLDVVHIKNITDVGHMRQEMLERGEDKIIAAALEEGKTPAEIAQFYTDRFLADERKLKIQPAHEFPKATDHIEEMIEIVEGLVEKGYAYEADGNVYFSVSEFPEYGQLSGNIHEAELLEAVRVEADPSSATRATSLSGRLPNRDEWSSGPAPGERASRDGT